MFGRLTSKHQLWLQDSREMKEGRRGLGAKATVAKRKMIFRKRKVLMGIISQGDPRVQRPSPKGAKREAWRQHLFLTPWMPLCKPDRLRGINRLLQLLLLV
jgi:hypothetical protein